MEPSEYEARVDGAANSAYRLLLSVEDFDRFCFLHNPDGGLMNPGDWDAAGPELASELADRAGVILSELRTLHELIADQEVWEGLSKANQIPATIGKTHAPNYAEAAFRLGDKRYSAIYFFVDYEFEMRELRLSDFPVISANSILVERKPAAGAEGFVRGCLLDAVEFDIDLAREHLAKEAFRATGKIALGTVIASDTLIVSTSDPRDRWMYGEKLKGKTHGEIITSLSKDHPNWEQLDNERSVGKAIERFASRSNKPTLRRKR